MKSIQSCLFQIFQRVERQTGFDLFRSRLGLISIALLFSFTAQAQVFINEIHYDNDGTDAGEAIEVAGPAGLDLAGWSIVLYNGSNGAVYTTTALAGTLPNQQNGFGTLFFSYPANGIQNGSPDGLALVDAGNSVIQFLSYEGSFTAVGGAADGLTSTDIGVSEVGTTPLGYSLQLGGSGSVAADFTWQAAQANTFGAVNTGQAFGAGDSAPFVSSSTPVGGAVAVALDTDVVLNFSEDVTTTGSWFDITCTLSGTHTAMVSGGPASFTLNPDLDFVNSESCTVTVFATQVTDVDSDDPPDNMLADHSFSFDTVGIAVQTTLVINEIDYDQPSTDTAEFLEIYNASASAINLAGYSVELVNGNGGGAAIYDTINLPNVVLAAGDFFVICANADTVPECDLDDSPDTNFIQNGSPDAVALRNNGVLIDTVSYEGDSGAPYTEGSGSGLDDPGTAGNDFLGISRLPDGIDTDSNNVDLSTRCITPGKANSSNNSACLDPRPPVLRINEIDYDQPGTDASEFIEIINAGATDADLTGVELKLVNGSNGLVYLTIALPEVSLAAGDYLVVCGNAATVANCDLDVTPDTNLIQNGSPDAVTLVRGADILDTVSYEGNTAAPYTEGSGDGLEDSAATGEDYRGISRFPNGADSDQNNLDFVYACVTPGGANTIHVSSCGANGPVVEIFDIQGAGATSPFVGVGVSTQDNIVTALAVDGFFMQTPNARDDGDVNTSNGIFVFTSAAPTVAVGDQVDVTGNIVEFFDFTEFSSGSSINVDSSGSALPAVTIFDASVPSPDPLAPSCAIEFECYEGMRVQITGGSVTGPNQRFGTDPIAEVHITAAGSRTYREPGIEFPGLLGYPVWDGNPEVFELDPDKLGLPNQIIPAGSSFDAIGVIGYEFGGYELWPSSVSITPAALPVAVRTREVAEMTVGALNLFRLFDDIDDAPIEVRDPDTDELLTTTDDEVFASDDYARRLTKFSAYIRSVLNAPDVLAVSEVESQKVLQDLADRIAADDGTVNYTAYLFEGNDIGGIDVGFLVRDNVAVDAVTQLGRFERLSVDGSLLNDRPPLLLEGRQIADGSDFPIAVMAIHGRSLSSIESSDRVRQKRLEQSQYVAVQVQALQDANPDINLVVAGDFNAYEFSDSYVDVTGQMKGDFTRTEDLVCETDPCDDLVDPNLLDQVLMIDSGERYSFVFAGNAQALDHALTSTGLDELVRDFQFGRGNSDAAVDLINDDSTPLRSSDHDGLVLFLIKDSDGDGVTDDLDHCPATVIPEAAPTVELRTNNFALTDNDRIFDTTDPNGVGPQASFDIFDTGGCSCEQIVAAQELGKGHLKFGCSLGEMEEWVELISQP